MNNLEQQIAIAIIAGTLICLIFVIAIILIVVKSHKRLRALQTDNDNKDHQITSLQNSVKQCNETYSRLYDNLHDQIPQSPERMFISYYNNMKEVEVHAKIEKLGIAVISDIGQLNYRIKLIDELFYDVKEIGEDDDVTEAERNSVEE